MGRPLLPPEVTPAQLDELFTSVIRIKPERERAVRLRLQGYVYREIVELINRENPNEAPVNKMWAERACKRAGKKLLKLLQAEDRKYDNLLGQSPNPLYAPANQTVVALVQGEQGHKHHRSKVRQVREEKRVYYCQCGSMNWTHTFVNRGGHRNIKIYTCSGCKKWVDAESRLKVDRMYRLSNNETELNEQQKGLDDI